MSNDRIPKADAPSGRSPGRRILFLIRRLHLYLGLFLVPWMLLYGITGFLFNHPGVLSEQPVVGFGPAEIAKTPLAHLPPPEGVANEVVASLNERDPRGGYRLIAPERARYSRDLVLLVARGDGEQHNVAVDLNSGTGTVRSRTIPEPPDPAPFVTDRDLRVAHPLPDQLREGVSAVLTEIGKPPETVTIPGAMPELIFWIESADGRQWKVRYQPQRGSLSGQPADTPSPPMPTQQFLAALHFAHGYPGRMNTRWAWALGVDAVSVMLVVWAGSGLLMWWQIKATRRLGFLILMAGIVAALILTVGMHRLLAP